MMNNLFRRAISYDMLQMSHYLAMLIYTSFEDVISAGSLPALPVKSKRSDERSAL